MGGLALHRTPMNWSCGKQATLQRQAWAAVQALGQDRCHDMESGTQLTSAATERFFSLGKLRSKWMSVRRVMELMRKLSMLCVLSILMAFGND